MMTQDGKKEALRQPKPQYLVPTMAWLKSREKNNGYVGASTFSGCGGSCLGFKFAGFNIRYASEFIPAAQQTYEANHPEVYLDKRDIRETLPDDILKQCGVKISELDVLEGSPPCASFSTAGNREADWGKIKTYSDGRQRTDDLFFEFARVIDGVRPRVFVAENVSGLVKGTAKGYFKIIHKTLSDCGYKVTAKMLDAQWLGVPQTRQRIIFIGVRGDVKAEPTFPTPLPYRYTIRDALPNVVKVIHDTSGQWGAGEVTDKPCPAVTVGVNSVNSLHFKVTDKESAEANFERYAIGEEWKKLRPGEQSEKYFNLVRPDADKPCPIVTQMGGVVGAASVTHPDEPRKFTIGELKRICGFPDDFIFTGDYRQQWERMGRAVPPVMMFHVARSVRELLRRVDGLPPWDGDPKEL